MWAEELTEWERIALFRFVIDQPETARLLALWALSQVDGAAFEPINPDFDAATRMLSVQWCPKCFELVVYDRNGAVLDWPPEAHACDFRRVALSQSVER